MHVKGFCACVYAEARQQAASMTVYVDAADAWEGRWWRKRRVAKRQNDELLL